MDFGLVLGVFHLLSNNMIWWFVHINHQLKLPLFFGEGLPNSWLEAELWRLKMTRMLLEVIWGVLKAHYLPERIFCYHSIKHWWILSGSGCFSSSFCWLPTTYWWFMYLKHHLYEHDFWRGPSKLWGASLEIEDEQAKDDKTVAGGYLRGFEGSLLNRKDLLLLYIHLNIDEFCLVLGVFLLHSADYQQHIWWFMYLKHHLFEHIFWRGPSRLWGAALEIEDEQAKDDQNVAAGHLRGLEGWQTERLFQPTFCYKSLWQCPFWSGSGCISSS